MRVLTYGLTAICVSALFVACGDREPAPEPVPPAPVEERSSAEEAAEAVRAAVGEMAEEAAEAADDAYEAAEDAADRAAEQAEELMEDAAEVLGLTEDDLHAQLVGTAWQVGDFHFTFVDASTVKIKGGALTTVAPDGLDGSYTYADGEIEVSAMGQTRTGTWDGETLEVDGTEAVLLSES